MIEEKWKVILGRETIPFNEREAGVLYDCNTDGNGGIFRGFLMQKDWKDDATILTCRVDSWAMREGLDKELVQEVLNKYHPQIVGFSERVSGALLSEHMKKGIDTLVGRFISRFLGRNHFPHDHFPQIANDDGDTIALCFHATTKGRLLSLPTILVNYRGTDGRYISARTGGVDINDETELFLQGILFQDIVHPSVH
jgi:hypothetical protein